LLSLVIVLLGAGPQNALAQDNLSDNLSAGTMGTEAASGNTVLTVSFATDDSTYTLTSVTLLLANPSPGQARLDLYSDGNLEPGSLLATLTPPDSYSDTLAETVFTADGIILSPNSTYWIVFSADSGKFDWAWTSDNTGNGVGFQHT
jgi:hypothetical protein